MQRSGKKGAVGGGEKRKNERDREREVEREKEREREGPVLDTLKGNIWDMQR